jgi:Flp pilus assembly protein TadD
VSTLLRRLRGSSAPSVAEHAAAFLDTLYLTGKVDAIATPADSSAEQGLVAARSGNWKQALEKFEDAATDEPQNARWWRAIGAAHAALREWPDASDAYLSAAKLAPADTTSFANAGVAFYRAARWTECVAAFQGAVNRAPRDATLRDGMGRCLIKLGDRAGAIQAFTAARALDASSTRYRMVLDSLSRPPTKEQQ